MRRYQRQIVAMMAIEQLTQAGRVPPITLTSQGSVGGELALSEWTDEIRTHQELVDKQKSAAADEDKKSQEAADEITTLQKDLTKDGLKDDEKKAIQAKVDAAKAKQQKAKAAQQAAKDEARRADARIAILKEQMGSGPGLAGSTAAQVSAAVAAANAEHVKEVAPFVLAIATKVLDIDDTGALCFEHYKNGGMANDKSHPVTGLCDAYLAQATASYNARTSYLDKCMTDHAGNPGALRACQDKALAPPKVMQMQGQ